MILPGFECTKFLLEETCRLRTDYIDETWKNIYVEIIDFRIGSVQHKFCSCCL